ncbi:MAG: heavy metal translocating P-type ATPase, partial [Actinomycetota bacterium]|nr:heavy metal translocating P-type ATPase [Actinomycetota bacterium]
HHDHEETVGIDRIKIGDVMIVKPGEKIAMDGIVAVGASSVDQASVTGESIPVDKVPGDRVFAGTINQYGAMEVEVTHLAADNTIAKITHMVEEAQAHKAPTQVFTERFGRYYTPIVMSLAAVVAVIPPLALGAPPAEWLHRALVLLVVACPCSLIISTPVALVSAIGNAAKSGVLVKGGAYLEAAGSLSVFAFDKTGTLTTGRPEVTDVISLNGLEENDILAITAAVESRSEHPVAQAIIRAAKDKGIEVPKVAEFQAVPGSGAYARLGEELYFVGSWKFFEERLLPLEAKPDILHLEESGKTVVFVATESRLIGAVALADKVRPQAGEAVKSLRRLGLKHIVMLTGDNEPTAGLVAAGVGVDAFHAELLPEDKVELMINLKRRYGGVAMVGDGVNDAPALAVATVGIAMGVAGSDVALETADIALMSDDITKLAYTVDLSRRTMRVIKQNIAFSLAAVAVLTIATLSGYLNLTLGIIGHEGSALAVIFNGMRLLKR